MEAVFRDPSAADVVKGDEGMNDEEETLQSTVQIMAQEAIQWREANLDPEQAEATDFYMGRPFGNEEKGRSAVVMTIVRDLVNTMLPSLMRIFFGSDRVVEYQPKGLEDTALAEQQTDYINHVVIQQDNEGFLTTHSVFKDALVRKMGIVKWWWEDMEKITGENLSGISLEELMRLDADEEVEELEVTEEYLVAIPNQLPMPAYDVEIRTRSVEGRARFAAIPPEEFVFSADARGIDEAALVGHYRLVPSAELIAMGIDAELVREHEQSRSNTRETSDGQLWDARRFDEGAVREDEATRPPKNGDVPFGEFYIRWAEDDGIAPMRKVRTIGKNFELVDDDPEIVGDMRPFAVFCPNPEPHTLVGLSIHDMAKDLQRVVSAIVRGVLDSLTLSLHPRMEVDINKVEMEDVLSEKMGHPIRSQGIGNISPVTHPFVGANAMPVLDYFTEVQENRFGISKASAGLAPDALQSSTRAAVAATVEGARQHIEMIARIFAETGMKRLYAGLYQLVKENQDYERVVKLRGTYVSVNPSDWDDEMDVVVNVALGGATKEERLMMLTQLIQDQKEQIMAGSPLVKLSNLRHSLAEAVELAGFRNPDAFYQPFGAEEQAAYEQQQAEQAAQQSQSDPEMALVEVEKMKAQADIQIRQQKAQMDAQSAQIDLQMKQMEFQIKQADQQMKAEIAAGKLELEQQKAAAEDDRARDQLAQEFALKQAEIEAKYAAQIRNSELQADVQRGIQQQESNDGAE